MSDEIIRAFGAEECERRRRECLRRLIVPMVEESLRKHPQFQSAVLSVAQYWNDEARDAVHGNLAMSLNLDPDIEQFYAESIRQEAVARNTDGECEAYEASWWLVEGVAALDHLVDPGFNEGYVPWDANGAAVPLFASFCKEGSSQEMAVGDAFSPYAVFRRDPAGGPPSIEVIGKALRPWLDGVRPLWWPAG